MPQGQLESFMRCLRRWAGAGSTLRLTDGQLLERFVKQREDRAFEALVRSHGPMVIAVCRRLLHNAHDAEDAFQATFLVLARKAASISKRESVGSWLYGVAYRIAARERSRQAQRPALLNELAKTAFRAQDSSTDSAENWSILSEELNRLPEKYRAPLVLHYLEGKTKDETAQQLDWPEGTVSGRLARGREILRGRLIQRGLSASSALVACAIASNEAVAVVPPSLLATTLQNAALATTRGVAGSAVVSAKVLALARGVQRAMLLSKLKMLAATVTGACVVITGTAWAIASLRTGQADEKPVPVAQPEVKKAQRPKTDMERLQGAWKVVFEKFSGREIPRERIESLDHYYIIRGNSIVIREGKILEGSVRINSAANPKTIDVTIGKGAEERKGIYVFEGDKLKICWASWVSQRPTKFSAEKEDKGDWIMIAEKDTKVEKKLEKQASEDKGKEARMRIAGNLYELGRAMHKYIENHGHFPHAAITSKEGKPLLSWRVALLPSLGFEELYKEFKLDEPWDSPHNKSLLAKMPKVFAAPECAKEDREGTYYQVFVGKDTVFEVGKDIRIQDITRGTVNAVLIIEAGKAVPWTKPEDLPYSADKPIPELGGAIGDGIISLVTADAAPHRLRKGVDDEFIANLRTFITRNGGLILDWKDLDP